jgi:hypothetical protein
MKRFFTVERRARTALSPKNLERAVRVGFATSPEKRIGILSVAARCALLFRIHTPV